MSADKCTHDWRERDYVCKLCRAVKRGAPPLWVFELRISPGLWAVLLAPWTFADGTAELMDARDAAREAIGKHAAKLSAAAMDSTAGVGCHEQRRTPRLDDAAAHAGLDREHRAGAC